MPRKYHRTGLAFWQYPALARSMATLANSFQMPEQPDEAQARFQGELGPVLHRMGFRLRDVQPGRLEFVPRFISLLQFLPRKARGETVAVDFLGEPTGTAVRVSGKATGGIKKLVSHLGEEAHWPANVDDKDWLIVARNDSFTEWDQVEDIDPTQLDPITRRALKRAGRLPRRADKS